MDMTINDLITLMFLVTGKVKFTEVNSEEHIYFKELHSKLKKQLDYIINS